MLVQNCLDWLKSLNILVPIDWVEACLQWIQEEHRSLSNPKQLQHKVYQQWLVANVRDLGVAVLPENIQSENKYVFSKNICLQIDYLRDVSQPSYGQLLAIQNSDNPNNYVSAETQFTQSNFKQNRMLKLALTDGIQTIYGMECKPLPELNLKSPPGTKIRIKAPVTCRRGVLMLKPSNVEILGGEVDEMVSLNNHHAVICRQLGVPYQPQEPAEENSNIVNPKEQTPAEEIPMNILDELMNDEEDFFDVAPNMQRVTNTSKRLLDGNRKRKLNNEAVLSSKTTNSRNDNKLTMKHNFEASPSPQDVIVIDSESPKKYYVQNDTNNELNINSYVHCIMVDDDDFETPVEDKLKKPTENKVHKYLCEVEEQDLLYPIVICTKAVVITLCSRLQYDKETGWSIIAKICDGTKTVNATFGNNVMLKLMGLPLNNQADTSSQNRTNTTLCKDALINMCEYMKIEINKNGSNLVFTVLDLENR